MSEGTPAAEAPLSSTKKRRNKAPKGPSKRFTGYKAKTTEEPIALEKAVETLKRSNW